MTPLIALSFAALYLPFLGKAFHIDDAYILLFARSIGVNPLGATPFDFPYGGALLKGFMPQEDVQPFLIAYYVKGLIAIFGESERALHAAFLIFPALASLGLWMIWRELWEAELPPVLLLMFVASPAFIVNSHNIMRDVPALGLVLSGVGLALRGLHRQSPLWGAGIMLSLAALTQYQMLAFGPLMAAYACLRRERRVTVYAALLLPVIAVGVWFTGVYLTQGYWVWGRDASHTSIAGVLTMVLSGGSVMPLKLVSALGHMGGSLLFFGLLWLARAPRASVIKYLALAAAALIAISTLTDYAAYECLMLALLVALAACALWLVCADAISAPTPKTLLLAAWPLMMLGYVVLLTPLSSARGVLAALPPLAMRLWPAQTPRWMLNTAFAAALSFGLACAAADYEMADSYRQLARNTPKAGQVWYIGEWGMRHYMDKAGARYLLMDSNEPVAGDTIVLASMASIWKPSPLVASRVKFLRQDDAGFALPLRLFNRKAHAGFYAHIWGYLPYAFSDAPLESFVILDVISDP